MISLQGVEKSFDDLQVLRGVDLEIEEGVITAIIGGSGCGKSVLLKHLIGLLKPDRGTVIVDGVDVPNLRYRELTEFRKRLGFVFQGGALFDSITVGENVGMGLARHTRLSRAEVAKCVSESLESVGLGGTENKYPAELSGGMKKRASIARALIMKPKFLLYDEPTTGLDPPRADSINRVIKELNEKLGITSIFVTHDMLSVYRIASRVAMLDAGVIRFYGTPAELARSREPAVVEFLESAAAYAWLDDKHQLGNGAT